MFKHKKLYVFDFDNTLAKTDGSVWYVKADGSRISLSSAECHTCKPKKDEYIDISDFNGVENPVIYWDMIEKIKKVQEDAVVLTSRTKYEPVRNFLKTLEIDVKVYAVGMKTPKRNMNEINAKRKKYKLKQLVEEKDYSYIEFWDDSKANIKQVEQLKKMFPNLVLITHLVKDGREITENN